MNRLKPYADHHGTWIDTALAFLAMSAILLGITYFTACPTKAAPRPLAAPASEAVPEPSRCSCPGSEGVASTSSDCGCVHKDKCQEPCVNCCGPNGYADCFKNPSPERGVEAGKK